ncbi:MAG: GSCFA domain-containing protein [Flavobacteriales bacterium]|nr:GSCFA domain-containing protein [Flavobacteriales bacterium]
MKLLLDSPEFNFDFTINHHDCIFTVGSCFSEEIAKKLSEFKFNVYSNPFGILFNPIAIETCIDRITNLNHYTENEVLLYDELYFSWDFHSQFNSTNKQDFLVQINKRITESNVQLQKSKTLFITLGTSFIYEYLESKKIVANCHKIPAKEFNKKLLTESEIISSLEKITSKLTAFNPDLKIVCTVSPVRHIKDGIIENNVSKSRLISAVYQICNTYSNCYYFPSYEIVIDELRDYRFYKSDLVHPNETAINYIWEKFSEVFFTNETKELNIKINKLNLSINHKPFNSNTEKHRTFLKSVKKNLEQLKSEYTYLDLQKELKLISSLTK